MPRNFSTWNDTAIALTFISLIERKTINKIPLTLNEYNELKETISLFLNYFKNKPSSQRFSLYNFTYENLKQIEDLNDKNENLDLISECWSNIVKANAKFTDRINIENLL